MSRRHDGHEKHEEHDDDDLPLFAAALRIREHLLACGLARVQASLAALVRARGAERIVGGELRYVLSITGREAAGRLGCSRQAVQKAAGVLQRHEWFAVVREGRQTVYILSDAAVRSLVPWHQRLDERLESAATDADVGNRVQPGATMCNRVQPEAVSVKGLDINPVFPTVFPTVLTRLAKRRLPTVADGCRRLPSEIPKPWIRDKGVTDQELHAAVVEENLSLLAWMHDVAVRLGWHQSRPAAEQTIADGSWFRFLVCAHHTATARGIPRGKRMACLVTRGKAGFAVATTTQTSDRWAAQMFAKRWRDPELADAARNE
jgi:hypothetical protein